MKILTFLLLATIALSSIAQQSLSSGRFSAPSAIYNHGQYYVYAPQDHRAASYWDAKAWHCLSSKDGEQWTDNGPVFSVDDITWANVWAWRSDVKIINGKYVMAFTAANKIGIATSQHPVGPFEDAIGKALITKETAHTKPLSPSIFIGEGRTVYVLYGHFYPKMARISRDYKKVMGKPESLKLKNYFGGLHMFKKDDLYYISYFTMNDKRQCSGKIVYATSATMNGPFEYRGVLVDTKSTTIGHSITNGADNEWKLFYHTDGASKYERHLQSVGMNFKDDGSILIRNN